MVEKLKILDFIKDNIENSDCYFICEHFYTYTKINKTSETLPSKQEEMNRIFPELYNLIMDVGNSFVRGFALGDPWYLSNILSLYGKENSNISYNEKKMYSKRYRIAKLNELKEQLINQK